MEAALSGSEPGRTPCPAWRRLPRAGFHSRPRQGTLGPQGENRPIQRNTVQRHRSLPVRAPETSKLRRPAEVESRRKAFLTERRANYPSSCRQPEEGERPPVRLPSPRPLPTEGGRRRKPEGAPEGESLPPDRDADVAVLRRDGVRASLGAACVGTGPVVQGRRPGIPVSPVEPTPLASATWRRQPHARPEVPSDQRRIAGPAARTPCSPGGPALRAPAEMQHGLRRRRELPVCVGPARSTRLTMTVST